MSIVWQSGTIGSAALRGLRDAGAGIARFVATGNEADLQEALAEAGLPFPREVMATTADEAARAAAARILYAAAQNAPGARVDGVLVAPMATGGTEVIPGAVTDPIFGPAVMVGLGGVFAEIFKDTALRLRPVTEDEAAGMLRE